MVGVLAVDELQGLAEADSDRFKQSTAAAADSSGGTSSSLDGIENVMVAISGCVGRQDVGLSKDIPEREGLELLQSKLEILVMREVTKGLLTSCSLVMAMWPSKAQVPCLSIEDQHTRRSRLPNSCSQKLCAEPSK